MENSDVASLIRPFGWDCSKLGKWGPMSWHTIFSDIMSNNYQWLAEVTSYFQWDQWNLPRELLRRSLYNHGDTGMYIPTSKRYLVLMSYGSMGCADLRTIRWLRLEPWYVVQRQRWSNVFFYLDCSSISCNRSIILTVAHPNFNIYMHFPQIPAESLRDWCRDDGDNPPQLLHQSQTQAMLQELQCCP